MKDNDKLKKILLHYINLEYYANGLDEEFSNLLSELEERCKKAITAYKNINTKSTYTTLMKVIKEEVDKFKDELRQRLEEEAEIIMQNELTFLDETYNKESYENEDYQDDDEELEDDEDEEGPDNIEKAKNERRNKRLLLTLGGITVSKILFSPIDGRDTTEQFVERIGKNIKQSFEAPLRSGYIFGRSAEDVTEQIDKSMAQVERGMSNGIKTAIPSYAKTTDKIVFIQNNKEVTWVSILDGKTCIVCAELNEMKFKSAAEAPTTHTLCRCTLILSSEITEELPTYEEFLNSLPEEEQKEILGKSRYEMWKNDGIKLERFVNNGRKLRLDEIDKE